MDGWMGRGESAAEKSAQKTAADDPRRRKWVNATRDEYSTNSEHGTRTNGREIIENEMCGRVTVKLCKYSES